MSAKQKQELKALKVKELDQASRKPAESDAVKGGIHLENCLISSYS